MGDEADFCSSDKPKVFYKLMVLLWLCGARSRHAQNNNFTIPLQYLKKNMKDEVDFLSI